MSNIVDPRTLAKDFWSEMDPSDFSIDRAYVGQKTSKNPKAVKGHFNFSSGTSTPLVENCKLIVPTKGRVLYGGPKGRALCASDNFMEPSPRIQTPVSKSCLDCPLKDWDYNEDKQLWSEKMITDHPIDLKKPLCQDSYSMLMATDKWAPFFISFQKTQIAVLKKQLLSRLRTEWFKHAPFHVAFDMGLKDEGTYYSVTFTNFREVEDKSMGTGLYQAWKSRASEAVAKQYEEMDNEKDEEVPF